MKVLVIKTSSLGDVIHTLPALTDAAEAIPAISFDWVVEQAFREVPGWHPAVDRVIEVSIRQWRQHPLRAWQTGEWQRFKQAIGRVHYDAVIDAQGLLKSAWLTRYSRGRVYGLDSDSAREPLASRFYDVQLKVARSQHAVERVRQLFARSLGYAYPKDRKGEYRLRFSGKRKNQVVLLHGTTWPTKHWAEQSWLELAGKLAGAGFEVLIPWGNEVEYQRARRIAGETSAQVLDKMSLTDIAQLLSESMGCIALDSGLGHLAAAVDTPTLALFGPTNPALTGFYGKFQASIKPALACAPCMSDSCRVEPGFFDAPPCLREHTADKVFKRFTAHLQACGVNE